MHKLIENEAEVIVAEKLDLRELRFKLVHVCLQFAVHLSRQPSINSAPSV